MKTITRVLLVVGCLGLLSRAVAAESDFKVGIQTWTLRNMNFEQVVDFAVKHEIKYLEMIDKHINPKGPAEETKRKKAILDKNGLVCYSFGVAGNSGKKKKEREIFVFVKLIGGKNIFVAPTDISQG